MPTREDALALETMAALLPQSNPERRELEAEAYLVWRDVDNKRAKALAKTWDPKHTPNLDRVLFKLYRRDPKQAKALIPWDWQYHEAYCRTWLKLLLRNWQEGDGPITALPLNACTNRKGTLTGAKIVAANLHRISPEDRDALIFPLLRQACVYSNLTEAKMLANIVIHASEKEQTTEFLERVCNLVLDMAEHDVEIWRRKFRRATRGHSGPSVRIARILGLARIFDTRYRYNKPKSVSGRFLARWRRLVDAVDWIEQIPSEKAKALVRQRHANLIKGTARHLREEAERCLR